jgi:hypothetical protein
VSVWYSVKNGTSTPEVRSVVFLSGTELNVKTSGLENGKFLRGSIYALVWYGPDEVAICGTNPPMGIIVPPIDQQALRQWFAMAHAGVMNMIQVNSKEERIWFFKLTDQ